MHFHPSLLFPRSLPSEERHWSLVAQRRARCSDWWVTFLPLTAGQGHLELFPGKTQTSAIHLGLGWGCNHVLIVSIPSQGRKGILCLQYRNLLPRLAAGCVPGASARSPCPSLLLQYLCHILSLKKNVKSLSPPYSFLLLLTLKKKNRVSYCSGCLKFTV